MIMSGERALSKNSKSIREQDSVTRNDRASKHQQQKSVSIDSNDSMKAGSITLPKTYFTSLKSVISQKPINMKGQTMRVSMA